MEEPLPGPSNAGSNQPQPGSSFQGHLDELTAKRSKKRIAHTLNPETGEGSSSQLAKKLKSIAASTKAKVKKDVGKRKRVETLGGFIADGENAEAEKGSKGTEEAFVFKVPAIPKKVTLSGTIANKSKENVQHHVFNRMTGEYDLRDQKVLDLNESIIHLNNIKEAKKAQDDQEELKRQRKLRSRQKKVKKAKKKEDRRQKRLKKEARSGAAEADEDECVTYQAFGSPGHDEAPEVAVRADKSAVDWDEFLKDRKNWSRCRPVEDFPFAPAKELFKQWARKGLAVEVPNYCIDYENENCDKEEGVDDDEDPVDDDSSETGERDVEIRWWFGTIVDFVGYKAIIQLEDLGTNPEREKYQLSLSLFSGKVRPLRWAGTMKKRLDPGPVVIKEGEILKSEELTKKVEEFYKLETITNMVQAFEFAKAKKVRDLRTCVYNWQSAACPEFPWCFRILDVVECEGERLHMKFVDADDELTEEDKKIVYHHKHRFLMPFMYAPTAGIELLGTTLRLSQVDPSVFPAVPEGLKIERGMICEVLYPKLQQALVVAKVSKVFKYGFVMMAMAREGSTDREMLHRIYHITDPHLVPIGFGQQYGIEVLDRYKQLDKGTAIDFLLFAERPAHPFEIGDKFEAVATAYADFVGPATVKKKAGHLVQVHFDSWREDRSYNYQWLDPLCDEIYPAGYCEIYNIDYKGNVALP